MHDETNESEAFQKAVRKIDRLCVGAETWLEQK
jgi:hypothetical protein